MRTKQAPLAAVAAVLIISSIQVFAIEDLKISIHCPDVWLTWPSIQYAETYIVQYRQTLNDGTPWVTLTNLMVPDPGTNWTTFVHSNQVQCPPGQTLGMNSAQSLDSENAAVMVAYDQTILMAAPKTGSGATVPLAMYPLGTDTNTLNIFETTKTVWLPQSADLDGPTFNGPDPMDPGSDPSAGFYQVVRNGVWFFGLTNGTLATGTITLPVEAGSLDGALGSVTISANGNPIEGTTMLSVPSPGPLSFTVDTRRLLNGNYYLQAVGTWWLPSTNEFDTAEYQIYSPSVLVTVSNPISYPDWVQEFRDGLMYIKATSAATNIDWRVDIYGQNGGYVRTFTNHSDDGLIDISWDLRDSGGTAHTNDSSFTTVTTITTTSAGSGPGSSFTDTNPPLIKVVDNYPDQGMWMVARASYIPTTVQNYDLYTNSVNNFAEMGENAGGVLPGEPYRHYGQAMVLSRATGITNWSQMYKVFLNHHEVRNFYFDGHGGPDMLGPGYDTNGEPTRSITASLISQALGNDTPGTNATRFRWVWLDACSTALGAWPQTFGLGNRENVALTNFVSRPGAFCGWDRETYAWTPGGQNTIATESINFRLWFVYYWWFEGRSLKGAFNEAEFLSDFDASHLKVYGYWGLLWDEYNTKGEWPP